jgi:hypothetical protein
MTELITDRPRSTPSFRTVLPELPNSKRSTDALRRALKGMRSLFKEGEKNDPLKVLGLVQCGNKSLMVYDGKYVSTRVFIV